MKTGFFVPGDILTAKSYNAGRVELSTGQPVNKGEQIHYLLWVDVIMINRFPPNSFRLVIVNQKKSWEKAIRIFNKGNSEYYEVICGDKSGRVVKSNSDIKFDSTIVTYDGINDIKLEVMKPGAFGIWSTIHTISIDVKYVDNYYNNTIFAYFDNDDDRFFANEANQIGPYINFE